MVADSIIAALRSVLGEGNFALHEPRFAGNEQRYVQECIASGGLYPVSKTLC
jgi:perosamine synthetase